MAEQMGTRGPGVFAGPLFNANMKAAGYFRNTE